MGHQACIVQGWATRRNAWVALVACMRKLLTIINAMLKHRTPWNPAPGTNA
jgi:hypothetical protein